MKSSHGLAYLNELKIGIDELQWLQFEGHERLMRRFLASFMSHGLICGRTRRNSLDSAWEVHDDDDDGTISIRAAVNRVVGGSNGSQAHAWAVDKDGYPIQLDEELDIGALPNDATWYTVACRRYLEQYERGVLNVTLGSANVTGVGTEFTRYAGVTTDGFGRGTRIRIAAGDTASGHTGTYEIDQVTSDTTLVLTAAVGGTANENGIPFTVAGEFAITIPADPDIHQRWIPEFEVMARHRDPANSDLILFDVKRDDAGAPKVTLIDRRAANLYRKAPNLSASRGLDIDNESYIDTSGALVEKKNAVYTGAAGEHAWDLALAREADDRMLALISIQATTTIHVREYDNEQDVWQNPAGGGAVTITAFGAWCALEQVPPETGTTHQSFFVHTGDFKVYQSPTTDNGQTFAVPAAIWDPTAVAANDRIVGLFSLLTRNHRLFLFGSYYHFHAVNPYTQIRYVYSDDYGVTWNTNANAGYGASPFVFNQDHINPAAVQGPDGLIHLSYKSSTGNIINLMSDDETGLAWALVAANYSSIAPLGGYTNHGPAPFVSPDNILAVLYSTENGGNVQVIRVAEVGDDDHAIGTAVLPITNRAKIQVSLASGSAVNLASRWRQMRDGSLMLISIDDDGANPLPAVSYMMKPNSLAYIDTAVQEI